MNNFVNWIIEVFRRIVNTLFLVSLAVLIAGGVVYWLSEGGSCGEGYMTHILIIMGHQNPIDLTGCLGRTFGIIDFALVWLIIPEVVVVLCARIEKLWVDEEALKLSIAEAWYPMYEGTPDAGKKAMRSAEKTIEAHKKRMLSGKKRG